MNLRWQPLLPDPATPGDNEGLPLAGSAFVRFSAVLDTGRDEVMPAEVLDDADAQILCGPRPALLGLGLDCPRIMGILNVTPDSFSDGGDLANARAARDRGVAMVAAGAEILDIGGESTRPGAEPVSAEDEIARLIPAIDALRDSGVSTPISVDTRKAEVARAALDAGADMINDVSAFRYDPEMISVVAEAGVPVCLMHSRDDPATMQRAAKYDDVAAEVAAALAERIELARNAGIAMSRIIADPGIGFAKTAAHNLDLLRRLTLFHGLGTALLLGASRKRFIGFATGVEAARDRVAGSIAVALHGAERGAHILRVHDVAETRQALDMWAALRSGAEKDDGNGA